MKHLFSIITLTFFCAIINVNMYGQADEPQKDLTNGTLEEQFDYVIDKSNKYQSFKVIKRTWMYTLKSHVLDSMKAFQGEIDELNAEIKDKASQISTLQGDLESVNGNLDSVTSERDNINFMGQAMSKDKYKTLMWSIIGGLAALFLFFLFKFRSSNSITKSVKDEFQRLQEEFAESKKTALAREQELARKLQDELNRNS